MQQNESMTQQKTTIAQKTAMAASVALFFATPVIILLRRKCGYRFLNAARIFAIALVLFCYGIGAMFSAETGFTVDMAGYASGLAIILFSGVVVVVGMLQRFLRWREITHGVPWHTYSRGVSLLSFLPLADSKIKRFVDPLACMVIGLVFLLIHLNFLSYYVWFAGTCLFIFEAWDFDTAMNQSLDMLDSLVESEVIQQNVEYYSQPNPPQRPLEQTAGIPTGIAPDIQHQIERRRNRAVTLPNDLVMPPPPPVQGQTGTLI
jgi:hypothetical protein